VLTAPNYVMNPQGQRIAVLLSMDVYQELLDDLEDMAAIIERQDEPLIDHAVVMAELKADGLL